ncbi:MAG: amidohydrolase family protein [Blastocatellia bacterium]
MKVIDTHQHLWDLDRFRYSWTVNHDRLNRSFRMADYLEAARGIEIAGSVHVEADVDEPFMAAETKWVLGLSEREESPLRGVVGAARPESDHFREHVDQIAGHPNLKGLRRILHTQPDELSQTTTFTENVRSLEGYDLSFDLCVLGRQLPLAIRLIRECPNVRFILDHCGNPDIKNRAYDPWRDHLREVAAFPNVDCKVSGIVVNADPENWTAEDLRPAVEHVIDAFGWDRVMFGSDWPVCTLAASYRKWFDILRELTRAAGEEKQRKLFSENALRVYRLIL